MMEAPLKRRSAAARLRGAITQTAVIFTYVVKIIMWHVIAFKGTKDWLMLL
jgi:hypothetical protein